jgi:hypothetical protein
LLSVQYNGITQVIGALAPGREAVYFVAPGNKLRALAALHCPFHSYNQMERFMV